MRVEVGRARGPDLPAAGPVTRDRAEAQDASGPDVAIGPPEVEPPRTADIVAFLDRTLGT